MGDFFPTNQSIEELVQSLVLSSSNSFSNSSLFQQVQNSQHKSNSANMKIVPNGQYKSYKNPFSDPRQCFQYQNRHLDHDSDYYSFDSSESFGVNQISKIQSFHSVNITLSQLLEQSQMTENCSNSSKPNTSNNVNDESLFQPPLKSQEQLTKENLFSSFYKPISTEPNNKVLQSLSQKFFQLIDNYDEMVFLRQFFKHQLNPENAIVRRLRPLSKNNIKFFNVNKETGELLNYLIDFSHLPLNMGEFNQFSWQRAKIFIFDNCGIGDDGFASLSKYIRKYQQIQKIYLANNKIYNVFKNQLKQFQRMDLLTVVNLQGNPLSEDSKDYIIQTEESNRKIKFFIFKIPNKNHNFIREQSIESGGASYYDDENEKFELISESEKQEVIKLLSPSFSPENIRSSFCDFFRFINSTSFLDLVIKLIGLLWDIKNDHSVISISWFLGKIDSLLKDIYLRKVNFVDLWKEIQNLMNRPQKISLQSPVMIQLKIMKYLFSESIMCIISVVGTKHIQKNLPEQFKILKTFFNVFNKILINCSIMACHSPNSNDSETKRKYQKTKKQALNQLIDEALKFIYFIIELHNKQQEKKIRKIQLPTKICLTQE